MKEILGKILAARRGPGSSSVSSIVTVPFGIFRMAVAQGWPSRTGISRDGSTSKGNER